MVHQLLQFLHIQKDMQDECWGSKIKGWWRTGDIRVKKPKKIFECWAKDKTKVTWGAQKSIIMSLESLNHNFGNDENVVDMIGHEAQYCQGTEDRFLPIRLERRPHRMSGWPRGWHQPPIPHWQWNNPTSYSRMDWLWSEPQPFQITRWGRSPKIILKLHMRVQGGTVTLLKSKITGGGSQWRNRHQSRNGEPQRKKGKTGEIEEFRVLEIGSVKWYKEHIPHQDRCGVIRWTPPETPVPVRCH